MWKLCYAHTIPDILLSNRDTIFIINQINSHVKIVHFIRCCLIVWSRSINWQKAPWTIQFRALKSLNFLRLYRWSPWQKTTLYILTFEVSENISILKKTSWKKLKKKNLSEWPLTFFGIFVLCFFPPQFCYLRMLLYQDS